MCEVASSFSAGRLEAALWEWKTLAPEQRAANEKY